MEPSGSQVSTAVPQSGGEGTALSCGSNAWNRAGPIWSIENHTIECLQQQETSIFHSVEGLVLKETYHAE
uniref:Uncharacterized protein n=1 Tax=Oryza nivara TaxID=4536 RepID=A0A0E0G3T8_ORYNI